MFKLCELVADYRWLPELNEMLSIKNSEWQDQRCLEIYLQKYIQEKDFDKADHFLNLIATRPNSSILNINNSETVQQLRFEQMKLASEKAIAEEDLIDTIWKKIMDEVYLKPTNLLVNHGMLFDVMLVENIDSRPDVKDGLWSHKASDRIKRSLRGKCGLTVERLQERRIPGDPHWKMSYIRKSKVVIFFFGVPQNVTTT
ncbi:unnamed protein product, partial [Lymnaea stagnalis]